MLIPPGFAHVIHTFTGAAVPRGAAITYGIQLEGSEFGQNRVIALHDNAGDNLMISLTGATTLQKTILKYGPNELGPVFEHSEARVGQATGDVDAPNTALLHRKRSGLGGRRNRGRFYLPGVPALATQVGGAIDPSSLVAFQTRADQFLTRLSTEGMPMVILHGTSSDPTTVTSLVVDAKAATQRRRLR